MTKRSRGAAAAAGPPRTAQSRRGEQRYVLGQRRTTAQPLAASWRPAQTAVLDRNEPDEVDEERGRSRGARIFSAYGWRLYAVPLLIVLTVLVVVNTARQGGNANAAGGSGSAGPPVATEGSVVPVNPGTGTAVLPAGGPFTQAGAGTWHVVPGSGPVVGNGPHLYHYQVAVEDGIDSPVYGGDDAFAHMVDATLDDPRSWIAAGTISLQRVDASYPNPDFVVKLTTPNTDHRPDLCGFQIQYEGSCYVAKGHQVIINLARWIRGALAFNGDLGTYRQYAINHEVGHAFGNHHVGCATDGGLAPVMMEQTFGVSDDYVYDLNDPEPANRGDLHRDGKVCKPNAWPYPQGPASPADTPPS